MGSECFQIAEHARCWEGGVPRVGMEVLGPFPMPAIYISSI